MSLKCTNLLLWLGLLWPIMSPAASLRVSLPGGDSLAFQWVLPGSFWMGSPEVELDRDGDESPQQEVEIEQGFYLGTFEVTQGQWQAVMGKNPAIFQQGADHLQRPVESVSWKDCQRFIDRLNQLGLGFFRLPTEAEWEYACRAGTKTRFYWGDDSTGSQVHQHAWANSRSMAITHPVGQKPPNPWGLYDMIGNVWEWCADPYARYGQAPRTDSLRVFRGGSWYDFAKSQRSANRHKHGWNERYPAIGLRLVLEKEVRELKLPGESGLRMVRIPAGEFMMGSDTNSVFYQKDELPAHPVRISEEFWLGQFEVTQAQWTAVMESNPSVYQRGKDAPQRPVEWVSWEDCQGFIHQLNQLGLGTFRLPTEAEWEYACRAGTESLFPWGEEIKPAEMRQYAWFNSEAAGQSQPVGMKQPNPWGLYDMHGNVWEWCQDWRDLYEGGPQTDPVGPSTGTERIYRGGSWFNEPEALRSANRHRHPPNAPFTNAGLRLVWLPE
ncbi:MAG: formylglycine-generating enzyme family protein [Bacteroidota bacterium]